ncbi:MAG: DNA-deoxyinosine glycosylase [Faecalibacterium sp.]|nr:DNA-deoxyinosine glycosylase [Ruminococcus sp.]MCM1391629.1 DNA-deoxyinosine glycosylase [Ruminococcus sp.]MCM1485762.1 DNA-deoxyinosine glycosylase [Faecalibacterium sp.]
MGEIIVHPIPPLYHENSDTLILGSFPSIKSREGEFFYHHPQNRFWKVIAAVTDSSVPVTIEEKRELILNNDLALWDSIGQCEIVGSQDSSIRNVKPNDIGKILKETKITRIFCNGATSYQYYQKLIYPNTSIEAVKLPSTSPANAMWSIERLINAWTVIKKLKSE